MKNFRIRFNDVEYKRIVKLWKYCEFSNISLERFIKMILHKEIFNYFNSLKDLDKF